MTLHLMDDLLLVPDNVPSHVPDLHPPRRILGFLAATAIHRLDGAIGEFPPLELGGMNVPLPIAEHYGFVAVPGGEEGHVKLALWEPELGVWGWVT